jgi:hypothetical protein
MVTRIHRPLNANVIVRQRYELSKQLQDLHVDVALFSETHLKPHERLFILLLSNRLPPGQKRHSQQPCRLPTSCLSRNDKGLYTNW